VTAARGPETFNGWVPALSMASACIALLVAGQLDGVSPQDVAEAESSHAVLHDGRMPGFSVESVTFPSRPGSFAPVVTPGDEQFLSPGLEDLLAPDPLFRGDGR
jgi:hypothetical protein